MSLTQLAINSPFSPADTQAPAIHRAEIHLRERTDSTPEERFFDGWIVGCQNVFGCESVKCAMTSHNAIAWATGIERRAWRWSEAKKIHSDGSPSFSRIDTVRVYENF